MLKKVFGSLVIFIFVIICPILVFAEGHALYNLGSDAGGRAEAVSASIDDAAAIWYNPGRMTAVKEKNLVVGVENTMIGFNFTPKGSPNNYESTADYFAVPHIYYVHPLGEKLAVGIGVNTPFGLGTEYDKTTSFKYETTGSEMQIINIMPSLGYKINDKLSVGGGLMVYIANGKATQQYPWPLFGALGGVDGELKLEGDATQLGGMVGFAYQLNEKTALSLVYRSQMRFWFEGELTLTNVPAASQALLGSGSTWKTDGKASQMTPDAVIIGASQKVSDKLLVELDVTWRNWTDGKGQVVSLDNALSYPVNPFLGPLSGYTAVPKFSESKRLWKNAGQVQLGTQYKINDQWLLDSGILYSMTPVREEYATLEIPDTNLYLLSVGPVYCKNQLKIQMPIAYVTNFKKDVNTQATPEYSGEWDINVWHIGIGASWNF